MSKLILIFFVSILSISCNGEIENNNININDTDSISADSRTDFNYFIITQYDSNYVLTYKTLAYGIEEIDIYAKNEDVISKVNYKLWDTVKQYSSIVEYKNANSEEYQNIINEYTKTKINFEIAEKQFKNEEISKQVLENIQTKLFLAKNKYDAIQNKINVIAPFNGVISAIYIKKGINTKIGQALFKISRNDTIKAKILLEQADYKLINKNIIPEIKLNDKIYIGKFNKSKTLNSKDLIYESELSFYNPNLDINIKDSVEIIIDTKTKNNRIFLPVNSVKFEKDTYVKVLENNGNIKNKIIKVGKIKNDSIEVVSGLNVGDKVIL